MVVTIIVASILLIFMFAIVSYLMPSDISYSGLSAEANQTVYSTVSASFSALSLWAVVPMVLVAAIIIALIIGAFKMFSASGAAE